jgi:hypothetical protein
LKNYLVCVRPWLWLAAVPVAVAPPGGAQDSRGSIHGTVTDAPWATVFELRSARFGLTDRDRSSPRDIHLAVGLPF